MLKRIRSIVLFAVILTACNNKPETNTTNTSAKDSAEKSSITENNSVTGLVNLDEELQDMTALTTADLEKLVPSELMGIARTDINANNNVGTAMVIATYAPENSSEMRLIIMD